MATNPSSVRQIVKAGLEAGLTNAQITANIQAAHPDKRAAAIPSKHIGWYRSKMKAVWNIKTPASVTEVLAEAGAIENGAEAVVAAPVVAAEPVVEAVVVDTPKNKKARRAAKRAEREQAQATA